MSEPTQITAQNYADARRIVQRSTATDLLQQPDGSYSPVTVVAPSSPVNSPIPTVSRAVGSLAGRVVYVVGQVAVGLVMLTVQIPYWVVMTMYERRRERVRFVDGSRSERVAGRVTVNEVNVNVNIQN